MTRTERRDARRRRRSERADERRRERLRRCALQDFREVCPGDWRPYEPLTPPRFARFLDIRFEMSAAGIPVYWGEYGMARWIHVQATQTEREYSMVFDRLDDLVGLYARLDVSSGRDTLGALKAAAIGGIAFGLFLL